MLVNYRQRNTPVDLSRSGTRSNPKVSTVYFSHRPEKAKFVQSVDNMP